MDVSEQIGSQPQSSDTSAELSRHASFLGSSAFSIEADPEDTAPSGDESVEGEAAQSEDGNELEANEGQEAASEPTLPAWMEDFKPEDVAKFKARYPTAFKRLSDPNTSADDLFLLRDKMNDFAEIQRLRAQDTGDEEPTLDDDQQSRASASQQPTEEQRKAYYEQIENIATTQLDQQAVSQLGERFASTLVKAFDENGNLTKEGAQNIGRVLATGAIDLIATTLPNLLPTRLEAVMPGLQEQYLGQVRQNSWDQIRSTVAPDGSTPYADLPAMGTQQWNDAIDNVLAQMPELRTMFPELPPNQRFAAQYKVAARLMSGQKLSPAQAAQTAEAAKRKAAEQESRRKAGKALGAGKAKANISAPGNGNGNSIMASYNARHGNVFSKR
jgi:hypothetical protein